MPDAFRVGGCGAVPVRNSGGRHTLTLNIYKTGTPLVPVARRVRLYWQPSGALIQERWSDEAGNVTFTSLAAGVYCAMALDHTGAYGAVSESELRVPQ